MSSPDQILRQAERLILSGAVEFPPSLLEMAQDILDKRRPPAPLTPEQDYWEDVAGRPKK